MDVLTGFSAKLRTTSKALDAVLDQIIDEHIKRGDSDQSDKKDFVDILLSLQRSGMLDISLTKENIKAILLVSLSLSLSPPYQRMTKTKSVFPSYRTCLWEQLIPLQQPWNGQWQSL